MKVPCGALALAIALASPAPLRAAPAGLDPVPHNAQTAVVQAYLTALREARYQAAYALLNAAARAYYRSAENLHSVYAADGYRVTAFTLLGAHGDEIRGRVYFVRETARFRDHAHDADLNITATVPVGVVPEGGRWHIKDPGHPWRAFATRASARANDVDVTVKKMSFFTHRIEAVLTFENTGSRFVTVLPYGRSLLRDAAGHPYRLIETRDWSLTDKVLFEGLRLPPNARYTGTLTFACEALDPSLRWFTLTIAPLLADGDDAPFEMRLDAIAADPPAR